MTIGEKLRELRIDKGLSQKQLSCQTNISQPTLARWELGISEPRASEIKTLCKFFHISADELIGTNN